MLIKRSWASDIDVNDAWNISCTLAKHRIYIYWSHPVVFPCDKMGFRIPIGFSSFREKYQKSNDRKRIFCFGGSTTFAFFCDYSESYPCYLENFLSDSVVFNFGLGALDVMGSLYVLIDLLRLGFIPDSVIFLDGINEKQAWFQGKNSSNDYYEETAYQYGYFKDLISLYYYGQCKRKSLRPWRYIKRLLFRDQSQGLQKQTNNHLFRFIVNQSETYLRTVSIIIKLANAWHFDTNFFLQATLWDVWKDEANSENLLRYEYIKLLYRNILEKSQGEITDLSTRVPLEPNMFFDWQHINSEGNKALAQYIGKEIKRQW